MGVEESIPRDIDLSLKTLVSAKLKQKQESYRFNMGGYR